MAMAVTHAKASGYERVIAGSSGNAGLAVAAVAGAVGLPAVVAGCTWLPETPAGPLRKLGADLRTLDTGPERVRFVYLGLAERVLVGSRGSSWWPSCCWPVAGAIRRPVV